MPIELRTLGALDLVGPSAARSRALLRQPKRLTLLAYLAIELPNGPRRRDTILALFWPESDDAHARAALRQALHVLRQSLGDDILAVAGDDQVALSPDTVHCDATAFANAIASAQWDTALHLYRGDLLPGLHLDDSPAFDQWLDSARQKLRRDAALAADHVSLLALAHGELDAALSAARRGVEILPCDEPATRRVMEVLDRQADRAGAVRAYRELERRMRAELDVAPSAQTRTLLDAVLARGEPGAPASVRVAKSRRVIARAARDAYERGLHYLDKRGEDNIALAIRLFEEARDNEPLYPLAYAGLGEGYLQMGYTNVMAPGDSFPRAIAAANRAIELDAGVAAAHVTLGFAQFYYDRDWAASERAFRRALALDAKSALAYDRNGYLLTVMGRTKEACRAVERASALAPLSLTITTDAGFVHFYAGQLAHARSDLESVLLRDPGNALAHLWLGRIEQETGNLDLAAQHYHATGPLRSWPPTIAAAGHLAALRGDDVGARRALSELQDIGQRRYVTAYAPALIHAALGHRDLAFHWLGKAVEERTNWVVWLGRDNRFQMLHSDPRFAAMLAGLGLPWRRVSAAESR